MSYNLTWRTQNLPYSQKQISINVPVGSVVSNASSLKFTGKGAASYGKIQQENQIRLLENFAGPTEPEYSTVGQTWYDTLNTVLKVCVSTAPDIVGWRTLNSTQVTEIGANPPSPAKLGDTWYSRSGSASGTLFLYTGIGRYPASTWNANSAVAPFTTYWPANNTSTLAFKINYSTFNAINYGEVFIGGYSAGVPADVQGSITIQGVVTPTPKGGIFTSMPSVNAYVVWDRTGVLVPPVMSGLAAVAFHCRQLPDGRWQFDNNSTWVDFTPTFGMLVIGVISVAERDDQSAPGVSAATPWVSAIELTSLSQVPDMLNYSAIGGWAQVFPTIERAAGRDEYDYVYSLVASLIGDEIAYGGSGAIGRSIKYLTNFQALDASVAQHLKAFIPVDDVVLAAGLPLDSLKVEPDSNDWDTLLAAAKYAVNRLELPAGIVSDISPQPFVTDGRQAPAILRAFDTGDVQYPDAGRLASKKPGAITLGRYYQETVNVLKAAIQNRYLLKGMMGATSVNTVSPLVSATSQTPQLGYTGQFNTTTTHSMRYRFAYADTNIQRFFFAGCGLAMILKHAPSASPTPSDTDLKALLDTKGRIRVFANMSFILDISDNAALAIPPIATGFQNITTAGTTIGTITYGTASVTFRAQLSTDSSTFDAITIFADITTTNACTGLTTVVNNYIHDGELYNNPGPTNVYPTPLTYISADKTGPFDASITAAP
jgi:hypothetical protein